jgi:hypothetical protein
VPDYFLIIAEDNGRPFFRFDCYNELGGRALRITSDGLGVELNDNWWVYSLDGLLWIFNGTDWLHTIKIGPGSFSDDNALSARFPEKLKELLPDAMIKIQQGRRVFEDPNRRRHRLTFGR